MFIRFVKLKNGFRLPENKHGCQSTSENAILPCVTWQDSESWIVQRFLVPPFWKRRRYWGRGWVAITVQYSVVMSIDFLLVIALLKQSARSWELRTWSTKMNYLDILTTSSRYFFTNVWAQGKRICILNWRGSTEPRLSSNQRATKSWPYYRFGCINEVRLIQDIFRSWETS